MNPAGRLAGVQSKSESGPSTNSNALRMRTTSVELVKYGARLNNDKAITREAAIDV